MTLEVRFTAQAERDLDEIYTYIAEHDGIARAERALQALEERCLAIAQFPERGNIPKELALLGIAEYREVHYKPYRMIYRILGDTVVVHAVLDGRRDMRTLLHHRLLR